MKVEKVIKQWISDFNNAKNNLGYITENLQNVYDTLIRVKKNDDLKEVEVSGLVDYCDKMINGYVFGDELMKREAKVLLKYLKTRYSVDIREILVMGNLRATTVYSTKK